MSDLSNIKNLSLDKLIADIDGKKFAVTSLTLTLKLNVPGTCELVLAQGKSVRQGRRSAASGGELDKSNLSAFTPVVVNIYINGQKTAIVLFRGIISSVSRIAAKNAAGSYAGTVVNCVMPQTLMQTYSMSGYRYWNSKNDGKGKGVARLTKEHDTLLRDLGKNTLSVLHPDAARSIHFREECAEYTPRMIGKLVEVASSKRFSSNSVEVHFDRRGRKVTPGSGLGAVSYKADESISDHGFRTLTKADPFLSSRSILNQQLFMNIVPMPCGKMDIIPAFPWFKETVGTVRRADILQLRDSTRLSPATEDLDAVIVPMIFRSEDGQTNDEGFQTWPEDKDTPVAGTFKVVHVPQWLSPYLDEYRSTGKKSPDLKNNKTNKNTKNNIDDKNEQYEIVGKIVAKAFFAELKNQGVMVSATVPWHRLEFLDALGYLMKIEQPIYDQSNEREDLYGYLSSASLKVQSTPGGSKAAMNLTFTHVRGEAVHNEFALDEHPVYSISGGPASKIRQFLAKPNRTFDRQTQISLEGGSYDDYLDKAIAEVEGKR